MSLIDKVIPTDGTAWTQGDATKADTVAWVADPVRGADAPKVLRFKVDTNYEWSGDAGRSPQHNRVEAIIWPKSPATNGHNFNWKPTVNSTVYWERMGYCWPADQAWPQESTGNTYGWEMSQTNDDSVSPNTHYFGNKILAYTDQTQAGVRFGNWTALTKQEWLDARGKWIHVITRIYYGNNGTGTEQVTLYLNGVKWKTGPTLTRSEMGSSNSAINRKFGIYRVKPTRSNSDPVVCYMDYAWATAEADLLDFQATFTGTGGGSTGGGGTGGGGTINPPATPTVDLNALVDGFDGTGVNTTTWPTSTGTPTVSNSELILAPNGGASDQKIVSAPIYNAPGKPLIVGPITAAAVTSGTGSVETRAVLNRNSTGSDRVTFKITKSDTDNTGQCVVLIVASGAEDTTLPVAASFPFDATAMKYVQFSPSADGSSIVVWTSPDGTTWTPRRNVNPSWHWDSPATVELDCRISAGTPVVSAARYGGVNVVTAAPPTASGATVTVPVPTGLSTGDDIILHLAHGSQSAKIVNAANLPFQDLTLVDGANFGDGVVAGNTLKHWVFAKSYDPTTDTQGWTISFDTPGEYAANAVRLSGVDGLATDDGLYASDFVATAVGTSHASPSLVTNVTNSTLLVFAAADTDTTNATWGAAPGAMTRAYNARESAGGINIAAYTEVIPASGASVTRTLTHGASVAGSLIAVLARPASTATVDPGPSSLVADGSVTAAKIATSLKPSGTAAAGDEALRALGTTATTAAAGNDSRLSRWWLLPSDWGAKVLSFPPDSAVGATTSFVGGSIYLVQAAASSTVTLTTMMWQTKSAAVGTANAILGVYDGTFPTANLLGKTADTAALWGVTNTNRTAALTATSAGSLTFGGTGTRVYFAVVFGTVGTTAPGLDRSANNSSSSANWGRTAAPYRSGVITGAFTDLPATLDMSTMAVNSAILLGAT